MESVAIVEFAPVFVIWMAPLLALGVAIFGALISFAWLHDTRSAREQ